MARAENPLRLSKPFSVYSAENISRSVASLLFGDKHLIKKVLLSMFSATTLIYVLAMAHPPLLRCKGGQAMPSTSSESKQVSYLEFEQLLERVHQLELGLCAQHSWSITTSRLLAAGRPVPPPVYQLSLFPPP